MTTQHDATMKERRVAGHRAVFLSVEQPWSLISSFAAQLCWTTTEKTQQPSSVRYLGRSTRKMQATLCLSGSILAGQETRIAENEESKTIRYQGDHWHDSTIWPGCFCVSLIGSVLDRREYTWTMVTSRHDLQNSLPSATARYWRTGRSLLPAEMFPVYGVHTFLVLNTRVVF